MARIGLPAERMSDGALLAGLDAGGTDVGLAFVRRFQRHVYGVAMAVLGDSDLAEDVAQQTFVRAWEAASRFDASKASVRTWLATIAHNLAVDTARRRRPMPLDPADLVRLLGSGRDEPELAAARRESAAELRAAIASLPAEQARAVVMAGVYGLTAKEISEAEGIPLGTAKTRIRTAMGKLRAVLEPGTVSRG